MVFLNLTQKLARHYLMLIFLKAILYRYTAYPATV